DTTLYFCQAYRETLESKIATLSLWDTRITTRDTKCEQTIFAMLAAAGFPKATSFACGCFARNCLSFP
ncbi:MAG: hypothetical protein PHO66_02060, partial [Eubacteriales bacterium]|nr:hypothetical protein [Eubacteriales bacterium]